MGWNILSPWRQQNAGQNLTISASVATSTAFGQYTGAIQISATGNCHVRIGNTAAATDMLVKATDPPYRMKVGPGDVLSVIQDGSSTGTLNVVELTP